MTEPWLQSFKPNADDLLDLLLPLVDDSMLRELAEADYGDTPETHLAPLLQFRDSRVLPVLDWHPAEVLELMRWSQPDEPDWKPGSPGKRGHLIRAFSCLVLLVSYELPANITAWLSLNETTIQLVDSLKALDNDFAPAGASFFAWCIEHLGPLDEEAAECAFFGLALLSLAVRHPAWNDDAIICLCKWIDEQFALMLERNYWLTRGETSWFSYVYKNSMNADQWIKVGRDLHEWAEALSPSEKATWVALIGRSLAEE